MDIPRSASSAAINRPMFPEAPSSSTSTVPTSKPSVMNRAISIKRTLCLLSVWTLSRTGEMFDPRRPRVLHLPTNTYASALWFSRATPCLDRTASSRSQAPARPQRGRQTADRRLPKGGTGESADRTSRKCRVLLRCRHGQAIRGAAVKAVVYDRYGSPDGLRVEDLPTPLPGVGQVRIRVVATSVNLSDWECLRGSPAYARIGGLRSPARRTLGSDIAGVVDEVGTAVTRFRPGDEVYGDNLALKGGFAEYVLA